MTFTLTLKCDNAAFGNDRYDMTNETARILADANVAVRSGHLNGKLRDHNGNTVGEWSFEP